MQFSTLIVIIIPTRACIFQNMTSFSHILKQDLEIFIIIIIIFFFGTSKINGSHASKM